MKKASRNLILENVRGNYVYLNCRSSKGKIGMQILVPAKSEMHKLILQTQRDLLIEGFGPSAWEERRAYKLPLRDPRDDGKKQDYYTGQMFFNTSYFANGGDEFPEVVNPAGKLASPSDFKSLCYDGAFFHVDVNFYTMAGKDGGKDGLAVALNNVMLLGNGEKLRASSAPATTVFAKFADSAYESSAETGDADDFDDFTSDTPAKSTSMSEWDDDIPF